MAPFFQKTKTAGPVSPGTGVAPGSLRTSNQKKRMQDRQTNDSASFANYLPPVDNSNNNNNSGIEAFNFNNAPGGGEGSGSYNATTAAQTMLGDNYYNKAMKFMSAEQLNDQIAKAQSYGRGIDLTQFKSNLDKFEGFQNANGEPFNFEGTQYLNVSDPMITANAPTLAQLMGDIGGGIGDMMGAGADLTQFKSNLDKFEGFQNANGEPFNFEGTQYLNVSDPMITANAPTLAQLMGDIGGGIGDMMGAGADFIMGGGTMGRVLGGLKDKFAQGKNFVGELTNPGDIRGRVNALSDEQQRRYYQLLPTMTYQQAFEQASGQAFARGGITSLN